MSSKCARVDEEMSGDDCGFAGEEPISSDEQPNDSDLEFLDDDIEEDEMDRNAVDRSFDALLADSQPMSSPEVIVKSKAAKKAIGQNKRKAERKVQAVAGARRLKKPSAAVAAVRDRGVNARNWCMTMYDCASLSSIFALSNDAFPVNAATMLVDKFKEKKIDVSYLIAGKEVCPTTSRVHLQCFVQFASKKRLTCLKKVETTIHWESCKGTPAQNYTYCSKEGMFSEFGSIPLTGAQATTKMWEDTLDLARKGNYLEINPRILITQVKNLEHIQRRFGIRTEFVNPTFHTGVWIYSKTPGRGKTDCLLAQFPSIYKKAQDLQWNDYTGQEYAVIDDFSQGNAKPLAGDLKLWTHHQAFIGRILYGTVPVHLRRLFVTSNYSIEDLFHHFGPEIYEPIRMRFRSFNWDIGNLKWSDRALDCWSEDNILLCPLGDTI